MSAHPSQITAADAAGRLPVTLPMLHEKKALGEPIVMVTAYDFPSARAAEAAGVDLVLVAVAARVGGVRLIDNVLVTSPGEATP